MNAQTYHLQPNSLYRNWLSQCFVLILLDCNILLFLGNIRNNDPNMNQSIPTTATPPTNQNQQQYFLQNMETLMDSINKGNLQSLNLNQWNNLMESMKDFDFQTMGLDANHWQELAFSFSQYISQQNIDTGSTSSSSLLQSPVHGSPSYTTSTPQSSLHTSRTSYNSSASYSGGSNHSHSIPGIKITPVSRTVQGGQQLDDEDEEDFDWESIM